MRTIKLGDPHIIADGTARDRITEYYGDETMKEILAGIDLEQRAPTIGAFYDKSAALFQSGLKYAQTEARAALDARWKATLDALAAAGVPETILTELRDLQQDDAMNTERQGFIIGWAVEAALGEE